MITVKIIKTSIFKTDKVEGNNFIVAYRGRALSVSSLSFDASSIEVKDGNLIIKTDICLVDGGKDLLGKPYPPKVMPKLDLEISMF